MHCFVVFVDIIWHPIFLCFLLWFCLVYWKGEHYWIFLCDSVPFLWGLILGLWIFLEFLCMGWYLWEYYQVSFLSSKPFSSSFIFLTYYVVQEPPLLCWKLSLLVEYFVPWKECFHIFLIPNNVFSSFGRWLSSVK